MTSIFGNGSTRSRTMLWAEYVLLLGGFVCLGWYGFEYAQSHAYQSYQGYKLDQTLSGRDATVVGYLRHLAGLRDDDSLAPAPVPDEPKFTRTLPRPKDGGLVGRIEIKRLNLSAIVREGVDDKTLSRAVGHVPETALPGENGNFAIAAHRDTFFRGLRKVKKGDVIKVTSPNGTFEYEVDSLKIVWPRNVEVLRPTKEPAVTLITCYPFNYVGNAPKRFIVRGRRISSEQDGTVADAAPAGKGGRT